MKPLPTLVILAAITLWIALFAASEYPDPKYDAVPDIYACVNQYEC